MIYKIKKSVFYVVVLMGFLLLSVGCVGHHDPSEKNPRGQEVSKPFILESVEHRKDIGTIITTKLGVKKLLFTYFLRGDIPPKGSKVVLIKQRKEFIMSMTYLYSLRVVK